MEKGKGVGEGEKGNEGGEEKWEERRGKGEAYLKEKGTWLDISIGVIRPPQREVPFPLATTKTRPIHSLHMTPQPRPNQPPPSPLILPETVLTQLKPTPPPLAKPDEMVGLVPTAIVATALDITMPGIRRTSTDALEVCMLAGPRTICRGRMLGLLRGCLVKRFRDGIEVEDEGEAGDEAGAQLG